MVHGHARRRRLLILIAFLLITSTPLIVEAYKTPERVNYVLRLSAMIEPGTSTITMKARLTLVRQRWLHIWVSRSGPVSGATIHFYSCNSRGHATNELGTALTNENGIADFSWSADHNGDYWFVAKFILKNREYDSHPDVN